MNQGIITPVYSSLGRIKKIAVFREYSITLNTNSSATRYQYVDYIPVQNEYVGLLDKFKDYNIQFVIFFDINDSKLEPIKIIERLLSFYPAPNIQGIPSRWIQDFIHFVPQSIEKPEQQKTLKQHVWVDEQNFYLPDWISDFLSKDSHIPEITEKPIEELCAGGNLLRGRHKDSDYLLVGDKYQCQLSHDQLQLLFNVKKEFVDFFPVECDNSFKHFFFHIDLYAAIIGKNDTKNYSGESWELVMGSYTIGHKQTKAFDGALKKTMRKIAERFKFIRVFEIPFPFFMVNGILRGYPLCNCLVQNYKEDGRRIITVFFPDYEDVLDKDYSEVVRFTIKMDKSDSIDAFHEGLIQALENLNTLSSYIEKRGYRNFSSLNLDEKIAETFKTLNHFKISIKSYLTALLKNEGITDVQFIRHNFKNLIESRGSLHCITKVLERDRVYLE